MQFEYFPLKFNSDAIKSGKVWTGLIKEAVLSVRLRSLKSRSDKHLSEETEKLFPALGTGIN